MNNNNVKMVTIPLPNVYLGYSLQTNEFQTSETE